MAVTIAQIKELRELTNAGMGACKDALNASNGNIEEAVKYLREKGLAIQAKRVDKESKQGVIAACSNSHSTAMALVEVNCETDFVANTDAYRKFTADCAQVALEGKDIAETLKDDYQMLLTKTGENVKIRRSERYELQGQGVLESYIHMGGKIGVLIEVGFTKSENKDAVKAVAHALCLQIAANAPRYLDAPDIPQAEIDAELEIKLNALKEQKGKLPPEQALVGIKKGMTAKFATQICLLKQEFVVNPDLTVEKYIAEEAKKLSDTLVVKRFTRFQLGA